ncbi:MAG: hypothetical protein QUS12_01060 [Methanosarcina sp.]|nr:hypothetical protein [Methanosarcina sp.]
MATAMEKSEIGVGFMVFPLAIDHINTSSDAYLCQCKAEIWEKMEICQIFWFSMSAFVNALNFHKIGTFLMVIKR